MGLRVGGEELESDSSEPRLVDALGLYRSSQGSMRGLGGKIVMS